MAEYYDDVAKIQKQVWKGDDQIGQEDLFELQDQIASLALKVAEEEGRTYDLIRMFPHLYSTV